MLTAFPHICPCRYKKGKIAFGEEKEYAAYIENLRDLAAGRGEQAPGFQCTEVIMIEA